MAKGKFSQPRSRNPEETPVPRRSRPTVEDETQVLPRQPEPDFPPQQTFEALSPQPPVDEEDAIDRAFLEMTGADDDALPEKALPPFLESLLGFVSRNRKFVLVGVCAVVLAIILCVIAIVSITAASDPYDGKILNNVIIASVNVGGMTKSEAEAAVSAVTANTFTQKSMVVELPDGTLELSPADTGAKLNVKAVVKAAYSYGRTGTKAEQQTAYNNSLTGNHTIGLLPYLDLDESYIQNVLKEYASQYDTVFVQSSYVLEGDMPALSTEEFDETAPCQTLVLNLGTPGLGFDTDTLYNDILDAYSFNTFRVKAEAADADATPDPLDLEAIYKEVCLEPVNASVNMQTYEPIPGSYGYTFDLEKAEKLVSQAEYGDTVRIPMEYTAPEILEDEVFFRDVLGSCETPHNTNENRNTNLRLACEALNGVILYPGDTFSYNETLGQRTKEKGYKPAPAYSGYDTVDTVGGGICQGSSTLYYCALLADLEIVDRINHGFAASYIDLGMDATVSWGGPDFKFRNNTNFPIKIEAEVSDGYVKMKILGTAEKDYYVKMEYTISATYAYETQYEEYTPEEAGTYYNGQVLQYGQNGYYIKTYRVKYDKETNEVISRDYEASSSYQYKDTIIVRIVANTPTEDTGSSDSGGSTETQEPSGSGGDSGSVPEAGGDSGNNAGSTPESGGDSGNNAGSTPESGGDTGNNAGSTPESGGDSGNSAGSTPEAGVSSGSDAGSTPESGGEGAE